MTIAGMPNGAKARAGTTTTNCWKQHMKICNAGRPSRGFRVHSSADGDNEAAKQLCTGRTSVTSTPRLVDGAIVSCRRVLFMFCRRGIYALAIVLGVPLLAALNAGSQEPEVVVVRSGDASLRALLWRPAGSGPFPAVPAESRQRTNTGRPRATRSGPSSRPKPSDPCSPDTATSSCICSGEGLACLPTRVSAASI